MSPWIFLVQAFLCLAVMAVGEAKNWNERVVDGIGHLATFEFGAAVALWSFGASTP